MTTARAGRSRISPPHNNQMLANNWRTGSSGWKRGLRSPETPAFSSPRSYHLDIRGRVTVGRGDLGVAKPGPESSRDPCVAAQGDSGSAREARDIMWRRNCGTAGPGRRHAASAT